MLSDDVMTDNNQGGLEQGSLWGTDAQTGRNAASEEQGGTHCDIHVDCALTPPDNYQGWIRWNNNRQRCSGRLCIARLVVRLVAVKLGDAVVVGWLGAFPVDPPNACQASISMAA